MGTFKNSPWATNLSILKTQDEKVDTGNAKFKSALYFLNEIDYTRGNLVMYTGEEC